MSPYVMSLKRSNLSKLAFPSHIKKEIQKKYNDTISNEITNFQFIFQELKNTQLFKVPFI